MTTATTNHRRTCRLLRMTGQDVLRIENGAVRHYLLRKSETQQGTVYDLARPDDNDPSQRITYCVWFSRSGKTMCDCPDAHYRGSVRPCKHVAALAALRQRGLI